MGSKACVGAEKEGIPTELLTHGDEEETLQREGHTQDEDALSESINEPPPSLLFTVSDTAMWSNVCVGAKKGGIPTERLKQAQKQGDEEEKAQRDGLTQKEEIGSIVLSESSEEPPTSLSCTVSDGVMGSNVCVGAKKGGIPMERLKQVQEQGDEEEKVRREGHTQSEEIRRNAFSESSEEPPPSLSFTILDRGMGSNVCMGAKKGGIPTEQLEQVQEQGMMRRCRERATFKTTKSEVLHCVRVAKSPHLHCRLQSRTGRWGAMSALEQAQEQGNEEEKVHREGDTQNKEIRSIALSESSEEPPPSLSFTVSNGAMGSNVCVGEEKGGIPMERLKQAQEQGDEEEKVQREGHTQIEVIRSIALSDGSKEPPASVSFTVSDRTMGSNVCVGAVKGGIPMERLKQAQEQGVEEEKVQREGHTQNKEIISVVLSEEPLSFTQSLSSALCQPCQAQPVENSPFDGPPNNIASLFQQLVQEKELLHEADKRNYYLTNTNYIQRQTIEQKNKEIHCLQHQLHNREWKYIQEINALNAKVKEHQDICRDLSMKIERTEHLLSQQLMADTGSYQDSAATPPLLQVAVDSVKNAIMVCASELFSRIKKNSLPINFVSMNLHSKDTHQIIKVALQSFLCHALFKGFEDPFFCASDGLPLFVKPANRKTHLLQVYKCCRDLDATQMLDKETEFIQFFGVKKSELCMQLKEQLLMTEDVQKTEDFITSELCSTDNKYYSKFLRLVKSVWVLHKLAFAFEPSAGIFRVGQGSILDEEFMEDVAGDDDEDDHVDDIIAESCGRVKQVRFMCVPGFIVRRTVIKSRVVCFGRSDCHICSQMEDPTPMTDD